ncbi:response regulator [Pontibacter sp. SGAir0037]|uniref:response regulator n=1 Tax=Pontibacter sp. SGAir0037 TaxID=2571030 RepID=UPI0010CD62E3|nr:response regulator [Pontibacter sp. SGAir0037]QCR22669.1 response regulator [Pontibacter sp. SGAir0037]
MPQIKNVLLVDDDSASNFIAQRLLKKVNSIEHISTTLNGKEALDFVEKHQGQDTYPDLILLDINMPVMNGFEFLEHFQRFSFSGPVRIVLLTSSISPKDVETASLYNIGEFINKPLTADKVQQLVLGA